MMLSLDFRAPFHVSRAVIPVFPDGIASREQKNFFLGYAEYV